MLPVADTASGQVPVQMWPGRDQVPLQMWQGCAQSGADVAEGALWQGVSHACDRARRIARAARRCSHARPIDRLTACFASQRLPLSGRGLVHALVWFRIQANSRHSNPSRQRSANVARCAPTAPCRRRTSLGRALGVVWPVRILRSDCLQSAAVCAWCTVLQRGALCCNAVHCGALCCNAVLCVATRCTVLQRGALCCNAAVRCSANIGTRPPTRRSSRRRSARSDSPHGTFVTLHCPESKQPLVSGPSAPVLQSVLNRPFR